MSVIRKDEMIREGYMKEAVEYLQPHFIFNTLTMIQQLCYESPEKAEEAVGDFASYLRGRIDTLRDSKTVTFERELLQLKHYMNLEKMRFGDGVRIVCDITYKDFMLPSMTIVSIIEDIVRLGNGTGSHTGNVSLSSVRKDDYAVVRIDSDSPSFEETSESVRTALERLKKQPDSDIKIERSNKKTAVIIRIKQQQTQDA